MTSGVVYIGLLFDFESTCLERKEFTIAACLRENGKSEFSIV